MIKVKKIRHALLIACILPLIAITVFVVLMTTGYKTPDRPAAKPSPTPAGRIGGTTVSKIGIGFGLSRNTQFLVERLKLPNDFVDLMPGKGDIELIREVENSGVMTACIARSLDDLQKIADLLKDSQASCDYLGYNPEQREGTPTEEFDDFSASVKKAQAIARSASAKLLTGPGLKYMLQHESIYSQAAAFTDVWMLQSQGYQILEKGTGAKTTPEKYRQNVERVAQMLKNGNPDIKLWVQIIVAPGGRPELAFSASEIAALAKSIEGVADAVRIYTAGAPDGIQTLNDFISLMRQ